MAGCSQSIVCCRAGYSLQVSFYGDGYFLKIFLCCGLFSTHIFVTGCSEWTSFYSWYVLVAGNSLLISFSVVFCCFSGSFLCGLQLFTDFFLEGQSLSTEIFVASIYLLISVLSDGKEGRPSTSTCLSRQPQPPSGRQKKQDEDAPLAAKSPLQPLAPASSWPPRQRRSCRR